MLTQNIASLDDGVFEESGPPSSFVALQRVVVRMLFDPGFTERVFSTRGQALSDLDLPRPLVTQLLSNDPRAFSADALRRTRALKILMEEFKATSALVLVESRRLRTLDLFFSSAPFHDAVQRRGYMALAYAQYIEQLLATELSSDHTRAALRVEGMLARARRSLRESRRGRSPKGLGDPSLIALAPGVAATKVPDGTLQTIQHIEAYLFEVGLLPAVALCDDAKRPEPLPALDPQSSTYWLSEPDPMGAVSLSEIDEDFGGILIALRTPCSLEHLVQRVNSEIDRTRVKGMVEALADAGLLMHAAARSKERGAP